MKKDDRESYGSECFESEEETPKKRKKFNLFNFFYERSEKRRRDLVYDPNHKRDLPFFFRMVFDHASNILYLNLMTVLGNFPIFLILLVFSENLHLKMTAPADPLFAPIYGALQLSAASPATSSLYGIYGAAADVSVWTPTVYVLFIVGIILLALTFGPVSVGTSYILRNIVKGEPIFLWSDFWYAIKRNKKQEFVFGVLDLGFMFLIAYDIYFFYINFNYSELSSMFSIFFCLGIFVAIIYSVMRFYIYIMMVTFDLSIKKLLKNAFIFAIVGFKRNICAFIGIALVIFINFMIAVLYVPIGIVLPLIFTISLCAFMAAYAAWPKIKEIMIDPYEDNEDNGENDVGVIEDT